MDREIPLYVPLVEGCPLLNLEESCRQYLISLMDVFIRDTPFRTKDIVRLHERILNDTSSGVSFSPSTIRRELLRMRKEGLIPVFEEAPKKEDRLFLWATVPDLSIVLDAQEETPIPVPRGSKDDVHHRMSKALSKFFLNIFRSVFS